MTEPMKCNPKSDNPSTFERGRQEGRTEATLEAIAATFDIFREENAEAHRAIFERLNTLPCSKERERIGKLEERLDANRTWTRLLWGLFISAVSAAVAWAFSQKGP